MSTMRPIGQGAGGEHVFADGDTLTAPGNITTNSIDLNVAIGSGHKLNLSADVEVKSGFTLGCESGGMINLPSLFKVNGSAVGATVTASNFNTLTNGGDATSLHNHSGAFSISATLPATPLVGELLCKTTTAATLARANCGAAATGKAVGTYDGTVGKFRVASADVRTVRFVGSLTLTNGDTAYLSATDGRATNVDPTTGDTTRTRHVLGTVWDNTGYDGGSNVTAQVLFVPEDPIYGSA